MIDLDFEAQLLLQGKKEEHEVIKWVFLKLISTADTQCLHTLWWGEANVSGRLRLGRMW